MQLDRTERRILGSLIEKRWSTPDQYPLTLNALVAACRQKSNRDPVLSLEEFEITGCLLSLREKGLVIVRERDGGHVPRYAERLTEELALGQNAAAILAELMLRGPQTASELVRRVKRMAPIGSLGAVEQEMVELARLHLARLLPKGSGQRYARWTHLLGAEEEREPDAEVEETLFTPTPMPPAPEAVPPAEPTPAEPPPAPTEVERLREEVAELRDRVERLEELLPPQPGGGPDLVG
jgi:uncharacterized protein YceH (UPF0502 family)